MGDYLKIWNQQNALSHFDLFNEIAKDVASPDFKDFTRGRKTELIRTLTGISAKENNAGLHEIFARPAVGILIGLISDEDENTRYEAVHGLGALGWHYEDDAPDALSAMACLIDDENKTIRRTVAHYAGVLGNKHKSIASHAFELLDTLRHDDDIAVRQECVLRRSEEHTSELQSH